MDLSKKYVHTDTNNSNPKHRDLFFLPFYASHFLLTLENLASLTSICLLVCSIPLYVTNHSALWVTSWLGLTIPNQPVEYLALALWVMPARGMDPDAS